MSSAEKFRELAAGYVDDELTPTERKEFEAMMEEHPELRADVAAFEKINNLTSQVRFEELSDPLWEAYGASWYRNAESALGWILFSVGAMIALLFGGWGLWSDFFRDPSVPLLGRVGAGAAIGGSVVILVSKLRETLFARKRDRYRKVMK
jgi:hypothetical protein